MPAPRDANRRVLIVEDDEATREAFSLILSQAGYFPYAVSHGQEALTFLEGHPPPSVIVLDLMMPVMDGYQFLNHQAADGRLADIPVIVCSASGEIPLRAAQLRAGGYLSKPVDPPALVAAVARYC
jgi:CheY-like chemotaxis protein